MNVLVTGANGYLGAHIVNSLLADGLTVLASCRSLMNAKFSEHENLKLIEGDITKESFIKQLCGENQIDALVHLVSLDHHKSNGPVEEISHVNVKPLWFLLENLSKKDLKKVVYFSTMQVLGRLPIENINENTPANPLNPYGLTHLLCEQITNFYNDSTNVNGLNIRLSNSYGAPIFKDNNCWWLVVNDLCQTAFNHGEIRLLSDGSPQRDFIHITDVSKVVSHLLVSDYPKDLKTLNISSSETRTIYELALIVKDVFRKMYNKDIPIILPDGISHEQALLKSNNEKFCIQNSELMKLKKFQFKSIEEGVQELFKYMEK